MTAGSCPGNLQNVSLDSVVRIGEERRALTDAHVRCA